MFGVKYNREHVYCQEGFLVALNLILGRVGSGKTSLCFDSIIDELNAAPEGAPMILLVPEQATFQAERLLAARSKNGGFSRAHVLGFRRLAHKVLLENGGGARPRITDLGKRLVLRRLLVKHQEDLKILGRAAKQRTFAETLASAIWEFKTFCIAPQRLVEMENTLGESPLAAKIHDLALLYQRFEDFLEGRYTDPEDTLTLLADTIPAAELIRGSRIWIDGFHWFTPQEYQVLSALMSTAGDITISLCLADPHAAEHQSDTALFHRQYHTYKELVKLGASHGLTRTEQQLKPGKRFAAAPVLGFLEEQFAAPKAAEWQGDTAALLVAEAANRRVEAEGIAREIIRLCRDEHYRWRDIAVLVRDSASYSEILEMVLTDYDIPYFSDRRRPAVHHPLAELIRSALEVVVDNWQYDPLFRCLKTDLFPLKRGDIDILENYCLEFGLKGSRWTDDKPWTFVRRLSLDEDSDVSDVQQQHLDDVNSVRAAVTTPLLQFQEQLKSAVTVADYTTAVYQLLVTLGVPEKLERWAVKAEEAKDLDQGREHRQLWESVVNLLDQLVETCGEETMTLPEYAQIAGEGLEGLALNLIPPGLDYVTISTLERSRTLEAKAVFVPGVNDGALPQRGREEGLLSDGEREFLANCGVELAPGSMPDAFHEQFIVYLALTRAKQFLWLSYPLADEDGKALSPSPIIGRLKRLKAIGSWRTLPVELAEGAEREYIVHPRRSLSALAGGLKAALTGGQPSPVWWQVYNWAQGNSAVHEAMQQAIDGLFHRNQTSALPGDVARRLYCKQGKLRGSVTRFEGYRACPFQYFSQYGLALKPRAVFKLAAPDFGQFLHAVLKAFGDSLAADGRRWQDISPGEAAKRCREITEQLAPKLQNEILLSSRQYQHIKSRLDRTVERSVGQLINFDGASAFKPAVFEQSFGRTGTDWPPLTFKLDDGTTVELAGQIDRLDQAQHDGQTYILVIDYKSGGAWIKMADVYYGLKLQLLTYLLVACQTAGPLLGGGDLIPAGALYYFLKNPKVSGKRPMSEEEIAKAIGSQLKMPGWVLAEPAVVKLLDTSIDGWSQYIKVWLKNEKFRTDNWSTLKTGEQFSVLLGHVHQLLADTAAQIISGHVAIEPYTLKERTPCGYCDYKPVCQFDALLPDNVFRVLADMEDEEALARLAGIEGGETL